MATVDSYLFTKSHFRCFSCLFSTTVIFISFAQRYTDTDCCSSLKFQPRDLYYFCPHLSLILSQW